MIQASTRKIVMHKHARAAIFSQGDIDVLLTKGDSGFIAFPEDAGKGTDVPIDMNLLADQGFPDAEPFYS